MTKEKKRSSYHYDDKPMKFDPESYQGLLANLEKAKSFGCYFRDGTRRVDFVIVYEKSHNPLKEAEHDARRNYYLNQVREHGLYLELDEVHEEEKIVVFVKVHASFEALCHMADHLKIEMPLRLKDIPLTLPQHFISETCYKMFNCVYCSRTGKEKAYDDELVIFHAFNEHEIDLFDIRDEEKFFTDSQRNEMVWEILQSVPNHPKEAKARGVETLIEHEIFECAYPVHDGYLDDYERLNKNKPNTLRQKLKDNWANWRNIFSLQPVHQVRTYFGEKIGFYFLFMDFYTKFLILPSVVGLITFIIGMTTYWNDEEIQAICDEHGVPGKYWMCPICEPPNCEPWLMSEEGCHKYKWEYALDNNCTIALSCFTLLWAMLFLKLWKRQEATFAAQWNTYSCKLYDAAIRPAYEKQAPEVRTNPVTMVQEPHIPYYARVFWISLSILATFLILCIAEAGLAGLVLSRIALYGGLKKIGGHLAKYNVEYSRWFIHLLIFVLVTITSKIYTKLVLKLTAFECPRTRQEFLSSVLWKFFVFEMLNEFLPICYAAWVKGKTVDTPLSLNIMSELCDGGCMAEVVELVFVLLFLRLLIGNALEIGVPMLKNCIKRRKECKDEYMVPQWLKDFYLNEVELDGVYEEYMEMMIQFAFVLLFITAFPLAPILCLINNILEIRLDATKLLLANRRPIPSRVRGIQIWNNFMDIIIKLAVVFNAALMAFTSDVIPRLYYGHNVQHHTMYYNDTATGHYHHRGFTAYSLSYINVSDWNDHHKTEEFHEHHIERCYYVGYRESNAPYSYKIDFWILTSIRVTVFAIYVVFFFVVMWLINWTMSDKPHRIKIKVARRNNVARKFIKAAHRKKSSSSTGFKETPI